MTLALYLYSHYDSKRVHKKFSYTLQHLTGEGEVLDEHTVFGNLEIFKGLRIWTLQITKGYPGRKKLFCGYLLPLRS